jgi:hypothetical protein
MPKVLINSACRHAMAESVFSPAQQTFVAGKVDLVLRPFDETEPSPSPLPHPLTPRVNELRLAQSSFPQIEFQPEETASPADTWVGLLSLPERLQWIPPEEAPLPYLQVDPPLPSRQPHPKAPIRRIGWVSAGNPEHFNDRNRSLGPESFGQFRLPASIQAFRVQPDTRLSDNLSFNSHAPEIELNDFSDTARWLETLNLVVTVDTSVAHLAGGLGIPVWILLPYAPDWRWGTDGETTRCYRSARLFRQPRPTDWQSVLQSVQESLETLAT